ncbi:response regulator [Pelagibius sp. 7325]|uniref:response regulator n=1 Tax=Pelagibius sp. 7325 TaxID=3131994 RepID=UPI0030EC325E
MGSQIRVLLVEDSADDADLLMWELKRGGFQPESRRVASRESFTGALEEGDWDIILCDFTMPGFSGAEALEILHRRGIDIPFIFVSGTLTEEMAVAAMRAGAHDYIVKDRLKRLVPAVERELRDATARHEQARDRQQRALAERRFREVLAMAPDAIVAADGAFRITLYNRAAEALFGHSAEEAIGQPLDLLLPARFVANHRDHMSDFAALPGGVQRMNERIEIFGRRKDGEEFPAEAAISKLVEDGHVTFMTVIRDVSERRALEAQLRQAQRMEAVGQLTGGLAHDFNNLLTVMIGNLDLLLERIDRDSEVAAMARVALEASLRGADLTRQLLAFARRQRLEPKAFDMNERIASTIELLRRTLGEPVEIETQFAADLWPVLADPAQLESAFANLAINARDAMPGGGRLVIETANKQLDDDYVAQNADVAPGSYVMLAVSDSGAGIAPAILDKVFDPFFTTKEMGQGTGLGLSMVYGFAKQSGGHVKIYSEIDYGTTVRLYLPCGDGRQREDAVAVGTESPVPGGDAKILVVEDSAAVRQVAVNHLRAFGYRVVEATSGREALETLAADDTIDLLFTDVVMPGGMSGPQLAQAARKRRPDLKVLFTSGYAESAIGSAPGAGLDGSLLSKPYRKDELARKLREVLDAGGGES